VKFGEENDAATRWKELLKHVGWLGSLDQLGWAHYWLFTRCTQTELAGLGEFFFTGVTICIMSERGSERSKQASKQWQGWLGYWVGSTADLPTHTPVAHYGEKPATCTSLLNKLR
jgi:hypothetical protein